MDTIRICKQCQKPLPENAAEGLCPACLAKVALGSEPAAPAPRIAPQVAELAAFFPQLEIIELLGMGGMGMVYKARQPRLDRIVALKILPMDSAQHPSFAERFNREAKALAKLNHPGIVDVYDFGQTGQYYYFVMEYVDGMNLRELLNNEKVTPHQALELVVQICTALQYAHDEGVVHRDIKPENILLNKKGQVKIADFGLAKLMGNAPDSALTMSQAAMGTLNYMAPEQRVDAQHVDNRADIYSLGVVFYEMLTGEVPMGRFDPPSKRVQVDVRLDEVVLRALEREPARRYQQVSEVKSNVETISATTPAAPAAPATPPAAPAPAIPPPNVVHWVVLPMIVLALLWGATFFGQGGFRILGILLFVCGPPSVIFNWRYRVARSKVGTKGLRLQQLPPAVKRRFLWRAAAVVAITIAAEIGVFFVMTKLDVVNTHMTEWKEEWFFPQSRSCEKIGLAGSFGRLLKPSGGAYAEVPQSWTVALKIYRKNSDPATLNLTLPGLRAEYDYPGGGKMQRVLDFEELTNWLHDSAQLDVAPPQVQTEARQLMELFKSYENTAPDSWNDFLNLAKADLRNFSFGGFSGASTFSAGSYEFLYALLAPMCLYYFLIMRALKRAGAEGRAEIDAGRWTPPPVAPPRFPTAIKVLFAMTPIPIVVAVMAGFNGERMGMLIILVSWGIILAIVVQLYSRQQIQKARARGLWPQLGELPTLEHVKRLTQAGEKILAIKLYRQMTNVPLMDAKIAVEKLAADLTPPHNVKAPPAAAPASPSTPAPAQAVRLQPPFSTILSFALYLLALLFSVAFTLVAIWGAWSFMPALGLLLFCGTLWVGARKLSSYLQISQARERGLWPPWGELATDEHVKRLAQAREKKLAIRLYRQIHGVSAAAAKEAVEKLAR